MKAVALLLCFTFASTLELQIPKFAWPWNSGSKIVGGQDVNINQIPYQVSVLHYNRHTCGGVILNNRHILTAAHCFDQVSNPREIQVRVGSSSAYHGGIIFDVKDIYIHDQYNDKTLDFDVAILTLAYGLRFDTNVQPAVLAADGYQPKANAEVIVSGWGKLSYQGPLPEQLQKVNLYIVDHDDCYVAYMENHELSERNICATVADGSKDACSGDSGGPLTEDGVVVGIVSWGVRCAEPDYPGVYSSIGYFRKWILEHTK